MGERIPAGHRIARVAMLATIASVVALLVLFWGADAVALGRAWLRVVDDWSELPHLW